MQLSFTVNQRQLGELEKLFREVPRKATVAAVRAMNDAAAHARTLTIRQLSASLGIKQKTLREKHRWGLSGAPREAVVVTKANKNTMQARVNIQSGRIPVIFFSPRPSQPGVGLKKKGPVNFGGRTGWKTVKYGTGVHWKMGRLGGRFERQAFIGRARRGQAASADIAESGHVGVFVRKEKHEGGPRLPIRQLYGPSVGEAALKDMDLRNQLEKAIPEKMAQRLDHEIGRILSGAV